MHKEKKREDNKIHKGKQVILFVKIVDPQMGCFEAKNMRVRKAFNVLALRFELWTTRTATIAFLIQKRVG